MKKLNSVSNFHPSAFSLHPFSFLLFYFLFCLIFLSGCCCLPCLTGRRPPVMTGEECEALDYGACLEEFDDDDEGFDEDCEEKEPLSPEFFDEYDPMLKVYRISVGDSLQISVFGEIETLIDNVMVAPDGRLYYALVDGIPAAGRTITEVKIDLEKELSKFYNNPQVTLSLQNSPTLNWKIMGMVGKPGIFMLNGPITIRQGIGAAGGLLQENYEYKAPQSDLETLADLERSFIIRNGKKLDIDFKQLIHGGDRKQDIYLKPGDYIYIAMIKYREVYVLGNVRVPNRVQYLDDMTLMQALATCGGWPIGGPYAADISNCIVIRGDLENPRFVRCNLNKIAFGEAKDFLLKPGDIIYVHDKPFRFAREVILFAINSFVQSFTTAAGSYYADTMWFHINFPTSTTGSSK